MDEHYLIGAERIQESVIQAGVDRARVREAKPSGFDGTCGCGEEIPEGRIALGYYRCVTCQSTLEGRRGR